jgi:hypothetical protein
MGAYVLRAERAWRGVNDAAVRHARFIKGESASTHRMALWQERQTLKSQAPQRFPINRYSVDRNAVPADALTGRFLSSQSTLAD